ncbi:hypothetical protein AVEN_268174-1 [Araneus ventricosus]|uniref:Uncharacterized protein n=1 Tax=Araneus ventricosus TaxID=182803 RepID=A0A4Y2M7S4_ARAVE|nr:hypothetical protein AVEN_268174-1 [Araneus ventricosus]
MRKRWKRPNNIRSAAESGRKKPQLAKADHPVRDRPLALPFLPLQIRQTPRELLFIWGRRHPFHYATSCHLTTSFNFKSPQEQYKTEWNKSIVKHRLSRIKLVKRLDFMVQNEHALKSDHAIA